MAIRHRHRRRPSLCQRYLLANIVALSFALSFWLSQKIARWLVPATAVWVETHGCHAYGKPISIRGKHRRFVRSEEWVLFVSPQSRRIRVVDGASRVPEISRRLRKRVRDVRCVAAAARWREEIEAVAPSVRRYTTRENASKRRFSPKFDDYSRRSKPQRRRRRCQSDRCPICAKRLRKISWHRVCAFQSSIAYASENG